MPLAKTMIMEMQCHLANRLSVAQLSANCTKCKDNENIFLSCKKFRHNQIHDWHWRHILGNLWASATKYGGRYNS